MGGREYFAVPHSSLFEHARYDATLRATLLPLRRRRPRDIPRLVN
ncbi:hypothetical protein [Thermofilum pendens]